MTIGDLATGWFVALLLGPYVGWQAGSGIGTLLYWAYEAHKRGRRLKRDHRS